MIAGFFFEIPAITYFRTLRHYHRPWELNGRVRNGNACDLPSKVTENWAAAAFAGGRPVHLTASGRCEAAGL